MDDYHHLALGTAKTKDSRFVRELPGEHLSIVRVLMVPGADPAEQAISELPRGKGPRPAVYCPFCGRLGKYSHTDNYDHFSHVSSDNECSPHELETVLHRRAKQLIRDQFVLARAAAHAITAQLQCSRCSTLYQKQLCKASSWDEEALERTLPDGLRPDLTILDQGLPIFIVEVCVTHAVPKEKTDLLRSHGHTGVEVDARTLFDHTGTAIWGYDKDLPSPRNTWGLETKPRLLNICPSCRVPSAPTDATALLVGAFSRQDPDAWRNVVEASGLPGEWRVALSISPGELVRNHTCYPEKLRDRTSIDASQITPKSLREKLFYGFKQEFGEDTLSYWASFEELANEPFKALAEEAAFFAADISGKTEQLSTSYGIRLKALKLAELAHTSTSRAESICRAQAWIGLALLRNSHRYGNTTLKKFTLNRWPGSMISCSSRKLFDRWVTQLNETKFIATLDIDGTTRIALHPLATKEYNITTELRSLRSKNRQRLHYIFQSHDKDLNAQQKAAVTAIARHTIAIVHGAAGTGKTRVIKGIVSTYRKLHWIILAPTGKAAERLRDVSAENRNCSAPITFAKLVSDKDVSDNYPSNRQYGVILDEVGFVSVEGFYSLLTVLKKLNVVRLVLAGDPKQLPSIGPGWVFGDLIRWARMKDQDLIAQVELTEVIRSNAELAVAANTVRAGGYPTSGTAVIITDPAPDLDAQVVEIVKDLHNQGSDSVQVLGATREVVRRINHVLQDRHNLNGRPLQSAPRLRIGDQVICTENYYGLERLFNGQQATIEAETEKEVELLSNGVQVMLPIEEIYRLDLGYALTIHKAQGSEWDSVVVLLPKTVSGFVKRPMIYTALTRSKRQAHFVATKETLTAAIKEEIYRDTALYFFLSRGIPSKSART